MWPSHLSQGDSHKSPSAPPHPPRELSLTQNTIPSSFFKPAEFGRLPQPTASTAATWDSPAIPSDPGLAIMQTSFATATTGKPNPESPPEIPLVIVITPGNPATSFNGAASMEAMEDGETVVSPVNRITVQVKPQRPKNGNSLVPPQRQRMQHTNSSFIVRPSAGLCTTVIEDSSTVNLTNRLMLDYRNCKNIVLDENGFLRTPLRFLNKLCFKMGINYHTETVVLLNDGPTQFRTEIYVAGFCGVAHAVSLGFSKQLAAAHLLERIRIEFPGIKEFCYGLFPGTAYTQIVTKLSEFCETENLDDVLVEVTDRRNGGRGALLETFEACFRSTGHQFEVKWECTCDLPNLSLMSVLSDHKFYGLRKTMPSQFDNMVQYKDYFAIGVDCPMLKDLHGALSIYAPSKLKTEWMRENGVPDTQIDHVLHDPTNRSRYLSAENMKNKMDRFRNTLAKALMVIDDEDSSEHSGNPPRPRNRQNRDGMMGGWPMNKGLQNAVAMETGDVNIDGQSDEADREVERIFHDGMES